MNPQNYPTDQFELYSVPTFETGEPEFPVGKDVASSKVEVEEGDTPEVLQRRVMEQAEWKILPKAIDLIANGKVKVENRRTHII